MEKDSVLEMRHIYKTFPGVKALQNVDFTLKKGEIHALMGENGAGKSTLIKVLTGVEEFETGEIMIDGCDHAIINRSPQEAQNRGISTFSHASAVSSYRRYRACRPASSTEHFRSSASFAASIRNS